MKTGVFRILIASCYCLIAQAQDFESFCKSCKDSKFHISSEVYYLIEQDGKWVSRPGLPDKAVLEYGQDGKIQAFKSTRHLPIGEVDYQGHSLWDGKQLKTLRTSSDQTTLFLNKSIDNMELASQMANMSAKPWLWLAVTIPRDIVGKGGVVLGSEDEIKSRFLAVIPFLKKDNLFELPYAKDVLCKVTMREDGSIEKFVLRSKDGVYERSVEVVERKKISGDSGDGITIPAKIVETQRIEGKGCQRIHNLVKASIGLNVPKDIFQLDVSKASAMYDDETKQFLPLK